MKSVFRRFIIGVCERLELLYWTGEPIFEDWLVWARLGIKVQRWRSPGCLSGGRHELERIEWTEQKKNP